MSTLKVDTITTISGTGNINVSRPLSGSGASLTSLPAANLTGALPALDGSSLTNLPSSTSPAFGRVVRTAGNITTTSTSFVDVTGATVTLTTGAFPVAYGVVQNHFNSGASAQQYFNIMIDSTLQHGTSGLFLRTHSSANNPSNGSFTGLSAALSAGSHTIKEQWRLSDGTSTIEATSSKNHLFYAYEVR
jgi:hypothetical protein